MKNYVIPVFVTAIMTGCGQSNNVSDASGTFEADEVIVSSEIPGKILAFNITEGMTIPKDSVIGLVDAQGLSLQKEQVEASIRSLNEKTMDVYPQVRLLEDQLGVQQSRMATLDRERKRFENLVKADAATQKQVDDIVAQIDALQKEMIVTRQQIAVQKNAVSTQNRSVLSEGAPLQKRIAQLDDQLSRSRIVNPIQGTVLAKYAEAGEVTSTGKALYKIADLSNVYLRAYVTGVQLPQIKLNQAVKVLIDSGEKKYREYTGTITWISDKAEFTPKTIQTKEERANLVYAVKIKVKNDGLLKIGMYGEVLLK